MELAVLSSPSPTCTCTFTTSASSFHHPSNLSLPLRSPFWVSVKTLSFHSDLQNFVLAAFRNHCRLYSRKLRFVGPSGAATAYLENQNPVFQFFNRIQGALPVVGLLSRILSDEGGIGGDRIQFMEFCTRVEKKCTPEASQAFQGFAMRYGKVAKPQFVLIWCWAAALGAGLLKSEDIMLGAARLRVSYDIQYEVDNLNLLMDAAAEKRSLSRSPLPCVPIESCAEKALDAICKCSMGRTTIDGDDAKLLTEILSTVFPSAQRAELERMVNSKVAGPVADAHCDDTDISSEDAIVTTETQAWREIESTVLEEEMGSIVQKQI
eukprot:c18552_g1_i1 orf=232-1197(+)